VCVCVGGDVSIYIYIHTSGGNNKGAFECVEAILIFVPMLFEIVWHIFVCTTPPGVSGVS